MFERIKNNTDEKESEGLSGQEALPTGGQLRAGLAQNFAKIFAVVGPLLAPTALSAESQEMPLIPSIESDTIIENVFGVDAIKTITEAGFKVRVTLKKPEAEGQKSYYIIHLGQTHESPEWFSRLQQGDQVNKFQKRLYHTISPVMQACGSDTPIFREGYFFTEIRGKELSDELNKKLQNIRIDIEGIDVSALKTARDIKSTATLLYQHFDFAETQRYYPRYAELMQLISKKANEIKDGIDVYKAQDDAEKEDLVYAEMAIAVIGGGFVSRFVQAKGALYKAVSRAFWGGEVNTLGAEDSESNKHALDMLEKIPEAETRLLEIKGEGQGKWRDTEDGVEMESLNSNENSKNKDEERFKVLYHARKKFVKSYVQTHPEYQRLQDIVANTKTAIHDARERVIYQKIEQFIQNPKYANIVENTKCIPVVYGSAHKFANSAQEWNVSVAAENVKFGVIEIKSK